MKAVYSIFDYFKEAFHINKVNKVLYGPQMFFILFKLFLLWGIGAVFYLLWLDKINIKTWVQENLGIYNIFVIMLIAGLGVLILGLLYGIISCVVEAGIYNMYKKSLLLGKTTNQDFWEGAHKYFIKFLIGYLLIAGGIFIFVITVIGLLLYIAIGFLTLTLGFTLIPMGLSIFFTMWKVSLVMNDSGVVDAFEDSFRFAKAHFVPLGILQIIHWSFTKSFFWLHERFNITNFFDRKHNENIPGLFNHPDRMPGLDGFIPQAIKMIRMFIMVIIPVVTIAFAVGALVGMVFEVYFSLALFVAYHHAFREPEENMEGEVEPDVV